MSKTHELKTWPQYFEAIANGVKTFEIRRNDRLFEVGDALRLREWEPAAGAPLGGSHTGRECTRHITYITDFAQQQGHVVLGISSEPRDSVPFVAELEALINKHSRENASNTPDFILADYIASILRSFEVATGARDAWYGVQLRPGVEYTGKER